MAKFAFALSIIVLLLVGAFWVWRMLDHRADRAAIAQLLERQPANPSMFSRALVADQPDPVRRYFTFMISEGTPLYTVAKLKMSGQFSLGTKDAPHYMAMEARQVLAPPNDFLWRASVWSGHMRFSGSDSEAWTRFWGWGVLPVARAGGAEDHARSAFGRYVAEAAFWTPAALLPGANVTWTAVRDDTIRVRVTDPPLTQTADIRIAPDGRPIDVSLMRWSNANPNQTYQLQPFGGTLSDFQTIEGFQVPLHVEAGNFFGTEDYFPFFVANVTDISFPARTEPR